ncbi:MAG: hypothetical protein IH825_04265 [Candidatus Marinimicrobia bacterium]|nr:hypothetical protein [Candidatus Neomarinimicrobiota bacterium]
MSNTITIKKVDLLHLFAAPQIQQQTWIENFIGDELEIEGKTDAKFLAQYYSYLLSCMRTRDQRIYNTLRQALRLNQQNHRPYILATLQSLIKRSGLDPDFIENIYDIGCGWSIWHELLQQVFPYAKVWRVDKDESVKPDMWRTLSEFVTIPPFATNNDIMSYENPHTVIFLSDTIHCKSYLRGLLYKFEQCVTIINESMPEFFLEHRLQESGGRLYYPDDLCPTSEGWKTIEYETALSHYLAIRLPKEET